MFSRCIATMMFAATLLSLSLSVLAVSVPAQHIISNIQDVTTQSNNLNDLLKTLNNTSAPPQVIQVSQTVASGLGAISQSISGDGATTSMQAGVSQFVGEDAALIAEALTTFATIHGNLQNSITDTYTIFVKYGPGTIAPIHQALQTTEGSVDTMFFSIIVSIPTHQKEVTSAQNSVIAAIQKSINTYST